MADIRNNRGAFIVIEGIDGSGKSSQAKMLYERLQHVGINTNLECEPTHGPIGTLCRDIIIDKSSENIKSMPGLVLSMLFAADRYNHIKNDDHGMLIYLNNGTNIICDRYYLSNIVYQSYTYYYTDENWQRIMDVVHVNSVNHSELQPDVTIYINTRPDVALSRIHQRNEEISTFETSVGKLTQIYNTYDKAIDVLRRNWNENIIEVDGNTDDMRKINDQIYHIVYPYLNKVNQK